MSSFPHLRDLPAEERQEQLRRLVDKDAEHEYPHPETASRSRGCDSRLRPHAPCGFCAWRRRCQPVEAQEKDIR
uniref:Uncharacterized protein n=1 Tax=Arundo donax TaxID=35708 RepID=A0A0A9AIW5_ARUDO